MADSKFWKTLAATFVAGIFYLAHSLQGSNPVGAFPGLTQELHAGDVATAISERFNHVKIITSSDDGKTINVWSTSPGNSAVTFKGSYKAN